jgi:KilA-N domain
MNLIKINDRAVKVDAEGRVSLTDMFSAAQASGIDAGKRNPGDWSREAGSQFIDFIANHLNTRKSGIYVSKRGKGGGTFAHWQIALAYAKYLSPDLHMQVNEIYARAQSGDVTLADEIADKATPEKQEWLAKRIQGKVARGKFTGVLQEHGVTGRGYGDCTNAVYKNILGGTKRDICVANNIPYKASLSLRDVMTVEQLTATAMAEIVSAKRIEKFDVKGNARCEQECDIAARSVAALLV